MNAENVNAPVSYTLDQMIRYSIDTRNFIEKTLKCAVIRNNIKQERDGKLTLTLLLDPSIEI